MGAWGYGPFENDEALDWGARLGESGDPEFAANILRELSEVAQLDRREGTTGIAAAEAIAASRGRPCDPLPDGVQDWLAATGARAGTAARDLALRVIGIIESGEDSELRLLWDEEPDGPSWHETVAALRGRLLARARKASSGPQVRRPRVRPGNVVELATSAGTFAYIQLASVTEQNKDLIRVLPGLHGQPLDDAGLAVLAGGESAFLTLGFFKAMITRVGGQARGNYPVPAACAAPQPLRTGLFDSTAPGAWEVEYGEREFTAEEFAGLYPDIDQTMLAKWGDFPFADTLLRMIECGWRPWMPHGNKGWMYPETYGEASRPERPAPYPVTAVPGKFLVDVQPPADAPPELSPRPLQVRSPPAGATSVHAPRGPQPLRPYRPATYPASVRVHAASGDGRCASMLREGGQRAIDQGASVMSARSHAASNAAMHAFTRSGSGK